MELLSDEMKHVTALVEEWTKSDEAELEATFGLQGIVDVQTFLNVVARLRSRGLKAVSQEDRLTISLNDGVRFTLTGGSVVEDYCRDDTLAGKNYIAIIKNRTATATAVKDTIDIGDYNLRIKSRRETNLSDTDALVKAALASWDRIPKFFRLIRRWTFIDAKKNLRYDLSMVRSTPIGKMQRSFKERNIVSSAPVYEIEVELVRGFAKETPVVNIRNTFLQGVGEVLRGIQGSPILIRKRDKLRVLEEYTALTGTNDFRGNKLVPLMKKNMIGQKDPSVSLDPDVPNITVDYNVTDKADGLRVLGFTDESGHLYMIDMAMNVYNTGLANKLCRKSLVDGEYITKDKYGKGMQALMLFDIWYAPEGTYVGNKPFKSERHPALTEWITNWKRDGPTRVIDSTKLDVKMKNYYFPNEKENIFKCVKMVFGASRDYYTDGLIFTPNSLPLPDKPNVAFKEQFKWKPAMDNTIDFLVKIDRNPDMPTMDKVSIGIHPGSGQEVRYKTLRLYVGSSAPPDPRSIILNQIPLSSLQAKGKYRAVLFNPTDFPDTEANTCYLKVQIDNATQEEFVATEPVQHDSDDASQLAPIPGTPIRDESIVEMRYDPKRPQGWRWIPIRVRADKMERYTRGTIEGTLNSLKTANGVWESIHDPITMSMITTGAEFPTAEEREVLAGAMPSAAFTTKYYERKATKHDLQKVGGLRSFHNLYIKEEILYGSILNKPGKSLIDLTVGRAGDLGRWERKKAGFVLGIDAAGINITDPHDGAYARYLDLLKKNLKARNKTQIPPMFFIVGDTSKNLQTGEAGESLLEQDMLRSIIGRTEAQGAVPPYVTNFGLGKLYDGADCMVCMYALHYFFENESMFNGFLQNIADNLKIGGYFAGTNFDGKKVFELLQKSGKAKGESYVGMDNGTPLWEITKEYEDADELPTDSSGFGLAIDVEFISIGSKHREYLVPWELLVSKMESIGCVLVPAEELKGLGLKHSTNLYEESYRMATAGKNSKLYPMSDAVKQFSFLNRWYIFKRVSDGVAQGVVGEQAALAQAPLQENQRAELAAASAAVRDAEGAEGTMMPSILRPGSLAAAQVAEKAAMEPIERAPLPAPTGPAVATAAAAEIPSAIVPVSQKTYAVADLIRFNETSPEKEPKLQLPSKYAPYALRHLCPSALFPIRDTTDPSDTKLYPSIRHFLAGMLIKYGNPKQADLAWTLFGSTGTIHQQFEARRLLNNITPAKNFELMKEEGEQVELKLKQTLIGSTIDTTLWNAKKNEMLTIAIKQRFEKDKWFCIIVDAAIRTGKYLLYNRPDSELGGKLNTKRRIEGENAYGKKIMELATTEPQLLKQCLALADPM